MDFITPKTMEYLSQNRSALTLGWEPDTMRPARLTSAAFSSSAIHHWQHDRAKLKFAPTRNKVTLNQITSQTPTTVGPTATTSAIRSSPRGGGTSIRPSFSIAISRRRRRKRPATTDLPESQTNLKRPPPEIRGRLFIRSLSGFGYRQGQGWGCRKSV